MNIEEIIHFSWLNKFLYTNKNLFNGFLDSKKYLIIQLNLSIKELSFIKKNYKDFVLILENILFTFNESWNKYFRNITFNTLKDWEKIHNNCIFMYSNNNWEAWYQHKDWYIELKSKIKKQKNKYKEIEKLIIEENLSVRNLMKIWIIQIRAREFYNFLKEKWVFEISKYNNNHKKYYLDNFLEIEKNLIISKIW
jgi:hypothetical protein